MAIELEKLVVQLVADNADLKAKLAESKSIVDKQTGGMSQAFKSFSGGVGSAFDAITSLKGLLAGAAASAFVAYTAKTFEAVDGIGKLAQTTGFGTKAIQELTYAASQSNVEASALNQGLTVFSRTVGDAAMGGETAEKAFRSLGVSIFDASGNLKSNETLLRETSTALSRVGTEAERAAMAQDLFGRGGQALLPLLSGGAKGLDDFAAKANALGIVLDKDLIAKADETNDKLSTMKQVVQAQLSKALIELAPVIQFTAEKIVAMAESTTWLVQKGKELYDWTKNAIGIAPAHAESIAKISSESSKAAEATEKETLAIARQNRVRREQQELLRENAQKLVDGTKSENKAEQLAKEIATLQAAEDQKLAIKGSTDEAILARQEALSVYYQEQNAREIEGLMAKNEAMRALDDEKYAADIAANQATIDSMIAAKMVSNDKQLDLENKNAAAKKKINEMTRADMQSTLGFISNLQHSKSKEMAAVGKAAAIANATMTTYSAAVKAYEVGMSAGFPVGIFLGPALAAAAVAAGLSNVANIAGVDVGFNRGVDMVPGTGSTDTVRAMLTPGERVVTRDTNKVLEQFLEDYRAMRAREVAPMMGGNAVIELRFTERLVDFVEARLIERGRLDVSLTAA